MCLYDKNSGDMKCFVLISLRWENIYHLADSPYIMGMQLVSWGLKQVNLYSCVILCSNKNNIPDFLRKNIFIQWDIMNHEDSQLHFFSVSQSHCSLAFTIMVEHYGKEHN